MKIGIIADIHSNLPALEAVLKKMPKVEHILCAGDIIGYYSFVNECIEKIRDKKIVSVLGNHEFALLNDKPCRENNNIIAKDSFKLTKSRITKENLEFLKKLKESEELEIDGLLIKMMHGGINDLIDEYVYPDSSEKIEQLASLDYDLIILGHTHIPFFAKNKIVNPGAVGQPRDGDPRASFAVFDTKTREIKLHRVKYNINKTVKAGKKDNIKEEVLRKLQHG